MIRQSYSIAAAPDRVAAARRAARTAVCRRARRPAVRTGRQLQ
ncbi:hypothetical protein BURMUCGD2M_3262 [Burkholderia multivorans CGD2M]|uniref:Uncharacterized protein n=1 Tax=Burkholderia multivorans CGD2 TaxID=513052 RepID=B9BXM5_9BURK|nr:hypothetical protein BURMUCGD2_3177 [Burkholderia multivorans CGD2]EEE10123.1 hypothetical protein BURMUCGD2M_3262 [Burkholderia multivorans CGD2M]